MPSISEGVATAFSSGTIRTTGVRMFISMAAAWAFAQSTPHVCQQVTTTRVHPEHESDSPVDGALGPERRLWGAASGEIPCCLDLVLKSRDVLFSDIQMVTFQA